jgi:hypothetical protein
MVGLFGTLSNREAQARLRQLSEKMDQLAASEAKPRSSTHTRRRLKPGLIPEAITRALAESVEPMRVRDIHAAVEELLGYSVSSGSVKNWLAKNAQGERPLFVRLARGRYCLITES